MSYDPKCLELAVYFFPTASRGLVAEVAQAVQDKIEEFSVTRTTMLEQQAFDLAAEELLRAQRTCSFCGHVAETSNGLVRHILECTGDPKHERRPLDEKDRELLARLQQENAK